MRYRRVTEVAKTVTDEAALLNLAALNEFGLSRTAIWFAPASPLRAGYASPR